MTFDDYCRRARLNALASKTAYFVTEVEGGYQVTTDPPNTDAIKYVARPSNVDQLTSLL